MNENVLEGTSDEITFSLEWEEADLANLLRTLRGRRNEEQKRALKRPRRSLTHEERARILKKTAGRCHICGGMINPSSYWEADHVLSWALGGKSEADNYLGAHGICNTCRWNHLPQEMQWIMKIGVWARRQMEGKSELGQEMLASFLKNERLREARKKKYRQTPDSQPSDPA